LWITVFLFSSNVFDTATSRAVSFHRLAGGHRIGFRVRPASSRVSQYPPEIRTGEWEFQAFNADRSLKPE
jgi:hypothetical protein